MSAAEMIHRGIKMKKIEVNLPEKTVSIFSKGTWETCNFYEAGLQPNGQYVLDTDEIEEYFNDKYENEILEISFIFLPSFSDIRSQIEEKLVEIYSEPQHYNTDIIVEKDGTVRTHNYFGNVDYRDSDILFVYTVTASETSEYFSMIRSNLSMEQVDFCDKMGYLSIYHTSSTNQDEWEQFESSDDDFQELLEIIEEKYNQEIE